MDAGMGNLRDVFEQWLGQPVVLRVSVSEFIVPIRGRILSADGDLLRVSVEGDWDLELPKSSVLAVEDALCSAMVM